MAKNGRVAHEMFRGIAAFGEIGTKISVKNTQTS